MLKSIKQYTIKNTKVMRESLQVVQIIISILLLAIIIPQTPTENIVLRKFVESGLFISYSEAKSFLKFLTWGITFIFLVLTFVLRVMQ